VSTDRALSTVNADTSGWRSEDFPAPESELPFVSIVVPVCNDPAEISATLNSLVRQSYSSSRYEVVVVDNGSTDRTPSMVQEYSETFEAIELVVEEERQGPYAARNRGIRATSGPVVAFVDADMEVGPRWIEGVARVMAASDAEYLACDVKLFSPGEEGTIAKYNRLKDLHVERFMDEHLFAPTCCLVVCRTVFEQLGLFDPRVRSGGDFEFGNRVHDDGRPVEFQPDLRLYHPTRNNLTALLRKAARIGRGKTQLCRYYPNRYGSLSATRSIHGASCRPPQNSSSGRSATGGRFRSPKSSYSLSSATSSRSRRHTGNCERSSTRQTPTPRTQKNCGSFFGVVSAVFPVAPVTGNKGLDRRQLGDPGVLTPVSRRFDLGFETGVVGILPYGQHSALLGGEHDLDCPVVVLVFRRLSRWISWTLHSGVFEGKPFTRFVTSNDSVAKC